jgi:hypothetical protein
MGKLFKFVGHVSRESRPESVLVESATSEHAEKVLRLNGPAVELEDWQVARLQHPAFGLHLEEVSKEAAVEQEPVVAQPGIDRASLSTDVPPDPGVALDLEEASKEELQNEAERVGADTHGARSKSDLRKAIESTEKKEA